MKQTFIFPLLWAQGDIFCEFKVYKPFGINHFDNLELSKSKCETFAFIAIKRNYANIFCIYETEPLISLENVL